MRGHEESVIVVQLEHLARGDVGHFLTAITDVDAPKARHPVKDLVPLAVGQVDALGTGDNPRALLGKFVIGGERVHVMRGVKCLQLGGGHVVGDMGHKEHLWEWGGKIGLRI